MGDSCIELSLNSNETSPKKDITDEGQDGVGSPTGRSTPENNCPICLGTPENKSFTDSCLHQFCFTCLLQWSRVKAECPLCKQGFKSIIHTVRSVGDYEQYYLNQPGAEGRLLDLFAHYEPHRTREPFRYRTTAVSSYLDYFVRLEEAISHVIPSVSTHSASTHWQRRRQRGTSDFRRNIYQQGLWVQRMTDVTGRFRESSPEFYRANPAQVHRLAPFLNRELNVLLYENNPHIEHVMSRILELITQVPIRSSSFSNAIAPYIGRHTEHFVHELHTFATSPFDLMGYDRHASYVSQSALAHETPSEPALSDNDSDVQILDIPARTAVAPAITLDTSESEVSDGCIVVDSVPAPAHPPEVITLDSEDEDEDDVVQVNIKLPPSRPRRVPLKRNWITINNIQVPTTSNNDNVNVSINIEHASSSRSPPPSSDLDWTPNNQSRRKIKKESSRKRKNIKVLPSKKVQRKNKKTRTSMEPSVTNRGNSILDYIDTSSSLSFSSSDESDHKPRLRSVVFKSIIKQELGADSPGCSTSYADNILFSSSDSDLSMTPPFDPDIPSTSRSIYRSSRRYRRSSSSEHISHKKCKHSKKKSKKDKK